MIIQSVISLKFKWLIADLIDNDVFLSFWTYNYLWWVSSTNENLTIEWGYQFVSLQMTIISLSYFSDHKRLYLLHYEANA